MTRLLLGAVLLGNIGLCVTALVPEMLAPPTQVWFNSTDYNNILHWTPTPDHSSSLQYQVQWKIYGEPEWLDVDRCQHIHRHQCDLSSVTSDPTEWYYARVRSFSTPSSKSAWALSPRFNPRGDTTISAPVLKVNATKKGIMVHVSPPRMHVRKMHKVHIVYRIYLNHSGGEMEVFEMGCCSRKLSLKNLDRNTQYCLQAQLMIPLQAKGSDRSSSKCVTLL